MGRGVGGMGGGEVGRLRMGGWGMWDGLWRGNRRKVGGAPGRSSGALRGSLGSIRRLKPLLIRSCALLAARGLLMGRSWAPAGRCKSRTLGSNTCFQ